MGSATTSGALSDPSSVRATFAETDLQQAALLEKYLNSTLSFLFFILSNVNQFRFVFTFFKNIF